MDDPLETLRDLIDRTPGAAAQLALAHENARTGHHAGAQIHCAITADAIVAAHPDRFPQEPDVAAFVLADKLYEFFGN